MRNANARCENVCQLMVPVVRPFTGAPQATEQAAQQRDEQGLHEEGEHDAPPPNPIARSTAISRARSETAEYMVLSAPNTAPRPITAAISVPSTVMSVVTTCDCFS